MRKRGNVAALLKTVRSLSSRILPRNTTRTAQKPSKIRPTASLLPRSIDESSIQARERTRKPPFSRHAYRLYPMKDNIHPREKARIVHGKNRPKTGRVYLSKAYRKGNGIANQENGSISTSDYGLHDESAATQDQGSPLSPCGRALLDKGGPPEMKTRRHPMTHTGNTNEPHNVHKCTKAIRQYLRT